MRLIASVHITLDGVMGSPEEWALPAIDEESGRLAAAELEAADALLLGRVTYEGFRGYWPTSTDPEAERMNALPKYVASRSLTAVDWNASLLAGDVGAQVRALKNGPGHDLLLLASAELANSLRAEIDEYRLLVHPLVHGRGKRYFTAGPAGLELASIDALTSGVVALTYRRPHA